MINTPTDDENILKKETSDTEELLNILQNDTKRFSWKLEVVGLDYDTRREELDAFDDELSDILYKERFKDFHVVSEFIKEITKNSVDHSDSNTAIELTMIRDQQTKKISVRFLITDEWPGLPWDEDEINRLFNWKSSENWKKKGNQNFGIGLYRIKWWRERLTMDIILHNKWKMQHLNDLGLQKNVKANDKFWYEWFGIFDLV